MAAQLGMDGDVVRRWIRLAADALAQTRSAIDALNVFPVPDSDTGTNLHLTLLSAATAVEAVPARAGLAEVWRAATQGAMLGACGNSGIIVSQLLRGLSDICASASPCDGPVVARAFEHAAVLARAAVSRPAEGTILTVADAAARAAAGSRAGSSLAEVVAAAAAGARLALARTQQQLDVLAASGVVDAGAAGLCVLLDALSAAVTGAAPAAYQVPAPSPRAALAPGHGDHRPGAYGYEVTYLLAAPEQLLGPLREQLDALGDSLVIVGGEGQWHVHVHVADAGAAIEAGLRAGAPHRITVTYLGASRPARGHRVVAIADGPGLEALLHGAGALVVPHRGGYPPSPAALSAAFRQAGEQAVIVPNGSQAAAAARTAAARLRAEGIEVSVISVCSPVQALAAVAVHDPDRDFRDDAAAMGAAAAAMRYASVRPAQDGPAGGDGPIVGLLAQDVAVRGVSQGEVAIAVADLLLADGPELVTLVEGPAADADLARLVAAHLQATDPVPQIDCYDGGPADAFLLIGAE